MPAHDVDRAPARRHMTVASSYHTNKVDEGRRVTVAMAGEGPAATQERPMRSPAQTTDSGATPSGTNPWGRLIRRRASTTSLGCRPTTPSSSPVERSGFELMWGLVRSLFGRRPHDRAA